MYHAVASATNGYGKPEAALRNVQLYHLFGDPMLRVRPPQPAE